MGGIREHFREVSDLASRLAAASDDAYLGHIPEEWFRETTDQEHRRLFSAETTVASFATVERAVSTERVASAIRSALRAAQITWMGDTSVVAVARSASGPVRVDLEGRGRTIRQEQFDIVVNCLWHDRVRIDETAGIIPGQPWLFRYKASVSIAVSGSVSLAHLPSATLLLGPYGDVVDHGNGDYYLSWYPRCRLSETRSADARGLFDVARAVDSQSLVAETIEGLARFIPALRGLASTSYRARVGGGVIYAVGTSDITDPASVLHQRASIGPLQYDNYITVDTGKYCTGPLFAMRAADMVGALAS